MEPGSLSIEVVELCLLSFPEFPFQYSVTANFLLHLLSFSRCIICTISKIVRSAQFFFFGREQEDLIIISPNFSKFQIFPIDLYHNDLSAVS